MKTQGGMHETAASMVDSDIGDRVVRGWHYRVCLVETNRMAVVAQQVVVVAEHVGAAKFDEKKRSEMIYIYVSLCGIFKKKKKN